jgi:hypothetical protein
MLQKETSFEGSIHFYNVHRCVLNSASSIECFRNMDIRLFVNSAITLGNSTGDPIVTSL